MGEFVSLLSNSENETDEIGRKLASVLQPGITIALDGELGSGKTRFVRAICDGLGVSDELVNSPTFVLMQSYTSGRLPVFHFDTYRLGDVDEFLAIGAEEYLTSESSICLVEWAEIVESVLPVDRLQIRITQTGAQSRTFKIAASGPSSQSVLAGLTALIAP